MSNKLETVLTDVTDLMELCVVPGKVVWLLNLDVVCINDDGNVLDAAVLAMSAALNNTWLPATQVLEETGRVVVDPDGEKIRLELKFIPIAVTLSGTLILLLNFRNLCLVLKSSLEFLLSS
jgi:exosome complex component RRP43